jgi:hypothetical protein
MRVPSFRIKVSADEFAGNDTTPRLIATAMTKRFM